MKKTICLLLFLAFLLCCGCVKEQTPSTTGTCTVSICCDALVGNDALNETKKDFVPSDGYILHETSVTFSESESVFDVLRRACAENVCTDDCAACQNGGVQLESVYTPVYGTHYIEGIHNLYEKDCGSMSGWVFLVNGKSASMGCSEVQVQNGDRIEWVYTTTGTP